MVELAERKDEIRKVIKEASPQIIRDLKGKEVLDFSKAIEKVAQTEERLGDKTPDEDLADKVKAQMLQVKSSRQSFEKGFSSRDHAEHPYAGR